MSGYPKLPTGPSAMGASGSRALDRAGGAFQTKNIANGVTAYAEGDFSKVIVEDDPEYITIGVGTGEVDKILDVTKYLYPFKKSISPVSGVSLGNGQFARCLRVYNTTLTPTSYSYEAYTGVFQNVTIGTEVSTSGTVFGGYLTKALQRSEYPITEVRWPITGGNLYTTATPICTFVGDYKEAKNKLTITPLLLDVSRTDGIGRKLYNPALVITGSNDTPRYRIFPVSFTRPLVEFCHLMIAETSNNHTIMLLAEHFFRPGEVDHMADYVPKLWLFRFPGHDLDGGLVNNITSLFADAMQPTPTAYPVLHYTPNAGNTYNTNLSETMAYMLICVLPGDVFVLFYRIRLTGGLWRSRVAKIEMAPFSAAVVYEDVDGGLIQSAVHIGQGQILAKRISGFPGIDKDVSLVLSSDGGATWNEVTPVGLDAPLKNQYFGDLTVHLPYVVDPVERSATVLMPAWNTTKKAYYVYETKDHGLTWKKQGRIYKPDTFRRVDSLVADDGGGNFERLAVGPNRVRKPDITIPDRYERP